MKEKLLMLCYRAPYPIKSGSEIRMYQFVEILSEVYDITLLYLQENKEETDMSPLYEKCDQVHSFYVGKPQRYLKALVGYTFLGEPLQIGYFYSKQMQAWIDAHIEEYPKVLCMHVRTASYLLHVDEKKRKECQLYMDGIDAITMNYYNSYLTSSGIHKLVNYMEYRRMEKYESRVYSEFKNTSLISERDREYVVNKMAVSCEPEIIYNYAIDYGYMPEVEKEPYTIAFMGKMNYAPNVEAVTKFVEHVYGTLKDAYPSLKFRIIGGNAAPEVERLAKIDGIELCGFVENPAEILQKSAIVIAPMVSGSGLQNKIVQAMYLGCTVVTTRIGADGLTSLEGQELVIAESLDDMREKMLFYLSADAREACATVGTNAREYIKKYYSYDNIRNQILKFLG